ncbi:MAG: sialidase family protein [Planctomycetota bacterium]
MTRISVTGFRKWMGYPRRMWEDYAYLNPKRKQGGTMKNFIQVLCTLACLGSVICVASAQEPAFAYLGQTPPGQEPKIFAPGLVNTGMHTRDFTMTPDGREIYFCVILGQYKLSNIVGCRFENGCWSAPQVVPGLDQPGVHYIEPHISVDGRKFFFASNRPVPGKAFDERDEDIWVMERQGTGWGEPHNLGAPVNTPGGEFFPTTTADGSLYFTGPDVGGKGEAIYCSKWIDGKYAVPERLPSQINAGKARYNAYFSPDGRLAIVPIWGLPDSLGGCDYYAVFHNEDGSWSEPVNLGATVNTAASDEHSASLSADGQYLFFMSARMPAAELMPAQLTYEYMVGLHRSAPNGNPAIYWVEASFIEKLRPGKK